MDSYRKRQPYFKRYGGYRRTYFKSGLGKRVFGGANKSSGAISSSYVGYRGQYRRFSGKPGYYFKGGLWGRFNGSAGLAPEFKFFDSDSTGNLLVANGLFIFNTINNVSRGTDASNRIGDRIMIRSIQFKMNISGINHFANDINLVVADACVRVLIVQDTQSNGTVPAIADVLRNNADNGAGTPDFTNRVRNVTWSARFKVLSDKTYDLNGKLTTSTHLISTAGAVQTVTEWEHFVQFDRKCCQEYMRTQIPVMYDAQGGAITQSSIRNNNIFVIAGCNLEADSLPNMNMTTRIRYTDV